MHTAGPRDGEWRRAATVDAIRAELNQRMAANRLSQAEFVKIMPAVLKARVERQDDVLVRHLAEYLPEDPHLTNHPG